MEAASVVSWKIRFEAAVGTGLLQGISTTHHDQLWIQWSADDGGKSHIQKALGNGQSTGP